MPLEGGDQAITVAVWPLLVFVGLVVAVAAVLLGASYLLGQRHLAPRMGQQYESGMPPTAFAPEGRPLEFYRIAVFFVVFDVEAVFIFAWAVSVRESGWQGFTIMLAFLAVLLAALAYLWRLGSLDFRSASREGRRS
jgi:NADH-quinone oxidoreductase subunit A